MKDKSEKLKEKKEYISKNKSIIPTEVLSKYELDFAINYTHESTKIEGNTLSLIENKMIIEDKISVGGKTLREIYEVENHNKTFQYVNNNIKNNIKLNSNIIKNIHEILMDNIMPSGIYRYVDIRITGASHQPPSRMEMQNRLEKFYYDLNNKGINPIKKAAWTHAEFVAIHPFTDGNGRVSRMIMNYILMENGYLPINIKAENKYEYYDALDKYAVNNDLSQFEKIVIELEEKQLDIYIKLINDILENQT